MLARYFWCVLEAISDTLPYYDPISQIARTTIETFASELESYLSMDSENTHFKSFVELIGPKRVELYMDELGCQLVKSLARHDDEEELTVSLASS